MRWAKSEQTFDDAPGPSRVMRASATSWPVAKRRVRSFSSRRRVRRSSETGTSGFTLRGDGGGSFKIACSVEISLPPAKGRAPVSSQ